MRLASNLATKRSLPRWYAIYTTASSLGATSSATGQRQLAEAVYRRPRDAGVGSAHDTALDVGEEDIRVS